jgi:hypothetical protein
MASEGKRNKPQAIEEKERGMRDGHHRKTTVIFLAWEALCRYSNGCHFGSHTGNQWRRFKNYASCTGYPDGKAHCPTSQQKVCRDVMAKQLLICALQTHQSACSIG